MAINVLFILILLFKFFIQIKHVTCALFRDKTRELKLFFNGLLIKLHFQ